MCKLTKHIQNVISGVESTQVHPQRSDPELLIVVSLLWRYASDYSHFVIYANVSTPVAF